MRSPVVCLTVDLEQDCPPFLSGYRGMEEGFPLLLQLFAEEGVPATFFCTGDVAERYPPAVRALVAQGHELGCHGMTHARFSELDEAGARDEIDRSSAILRRFGAVTSFRAPYLSFPAPYLALLQQAGYDVDCSLAAYKPAGAGARVARAGLRRLRASIPPSVLRLPRALREPWLAALRTPVVLFVHPWEFLDLRRTSLRLDCRYATGEPALRSLREVIRYYAARGAAFQSASEAAT
ncbi:MAG TPA: polysaccharide deacetylase family protein [Longimicrobiales bacterium]